MTSKEANCKFHFLWDYILTSEDARLTHLAAVTLFGTSYHETLFQLYRIIFKISVVFFTFNNLNLDDFSDERAKEGGGRGGEGGERGRGRGSMNLINCDDKFSRTPTGLFAGTYKRGEISSVETTRLARTETHHDFLGHGDLLLVSLYGRQGGESVLVPQ